MLAKVGILYENVVIMSGEYRSTATGGNIVRITFSPEAKEQTFRASAAKKLGEAANSALSLENDLDELRATIEKVTAERDRLAATQVAFVTETPPIQIEVGANNAQIGAGDSVIEPAGLGEEAEVVMFDRSTEAADSDEDKASNEAEVAATETASLEVLQTATPLPAEARFSRKEVRRLSRSAQSQIIREIVSHEDFIPSGRLEVDNVSGEIKKRVMQRTGMSEEQWKNTFSALRQKNIVTLETYPHNPKRSFALMIDVGAIAKAIEKNELFTSKEDESFKEYFSEMRARELSNVTKDDQLHPQALVAPQTSQSPASQTTPQVADVVERPPKPAIALPKSGALRRAERYEQRQREEREAAAQRDARTAIGGMRRHSVAEEIDRNDIILPDYDKISEEEWKVMNGDDDIKLLVALITDKTAKTQAELLREVVRTGRIDVKNDPKRLAAIIKRSKNIPQPKIEFTPADKAEDGMLRLGLTNAGKDDLATQFRKVQLAVIRAKEAQAPSRAA